jgi:hypothetical protein
MDSVQHLASALGERAVRRVGKRVTETTARLNTYAQGGGGGLVSAFTGSTGDGDGGGDKPGLTGRLSDAAGKAKDVVAPAAGRVKDKVGGLVGGVRDAVGSRGESEGGAPDGGGPDSERDDGVKATNIVEDIDVGVPVEVAYDQWTRFTDFPHFMKKVDNVAQVSDEKLRWTARVLWSRRTWESTILEQVPDERIVWHSEGDKGHVDGAVTFHELAPDLTRVMLVLEYHPRGLFERAGNLWRAQGRRARLELKNFRRHVMTETILHTDELEGWRGEIHDGRVVDEDDTESRDADEPEDEEEDETEPEEEEEEEQEEEEEDEGEAQDEQEDEKPTRRRRR